MVTPKNSISPDQTEHSPSSEQSPSQNPLLEPLMPVQPVAPPQSKLFHDPVPLFQQLRLRTKVALCAIAISMLPAVGIGMIQYGQLQADSATNPDQALVQKKQHEARSVLLAYLGTAALTAILAGELAIFFTNRLTRSLLLAAKTARKLGQGNLDARLAVKGNDELAVLAANLNWMATQFQVKLSQPSTETQLIELLKQITLHLAQSQQVDESLKLVVQAVRQILQFDRVLIYRIEPEQGEILITESVNSERVSVMDIAIGEPWLNPTVTYTAGQVEHFDTIAEANLPEQILRQLTALSVKAGLTVPIVVQDQLLGVFIAHHCSQTHAWDKDEIEVCVQIATQIGLAWERERKEANLAQLTNQTELTAQAHREQQALLQAQLNELLKTFEQAASGDFTVRTAVNLQERETAIGEGEVVPAETCDRIAAAFNQTLENLQKIAIEIKQSAVQVETQAQANEHHLGQLGTVTTTQVETLTQTTQTIEDLIRSLQTNGVRVDQVAPDLQGVVDRLVAKAQTIKQRGSTLSGCSEVATIPIKQVKRFARDCQELAQKVAAANQLLVKINTVVLNAAVHPTQASGGTAGISMVASHLAELSNQSSTAIQEIEQTVTNLQHESDTVISGIKQAISFISLGKEFVELSDQQLEQTQIISEQIQQLMQSVSSTTETQIQTTQTVLDSLQKLSTGSQEISSETREVEASLQQIMQMTQKLQGSIEPFKLDN